MYQPAHLDDNQAARCCADIVDSSQPFWSLRKQVPLAHWRQRIIACGCLALHCNLEQCAELSPVRAAINTPYCHWKVQLLQNDTQGRRRLQRPAVQVLYRHAK